MSFLLKSEQETQAFAKVLSTFCRTGVIYLQGDLGAGKTTWSQAFIRAAGFSGRVKSPTYTLIEPYELSERNIYHFDLYRLQDEEELLFLGCDEYFDAAKQTEKQNQKLTLCLIEWPEKAASVLPSADIVLRIEHVHGHPTSRSVTMIPHSAHGEQLASAMHLELEPFERI